MEGKGRIVSVVSGISNFFLIFLANVAMRCVPIVVRKCVRALQLDCQHCASRA